ncbi:thioredoxin family protein [Porphyromonas levii]|uniref:Redoxin domain-containing protein n=1 Tax=Porphyromonas levii TaxID=28114 RepID=A0A4Y8WN81_9PORP|nr:thioredoxin domain-containing protein [Porphyromonas levii]MBR8704143.1 hypothetical protein [Porphyromonas levii]MBR8714039.1 hypothetical protein [Porphyromonas levii]MBR8716047.1 hypothetical protein [Porphyromonas levii]MBR8728585.1 hypothetical protein [Porphyromonas levii]MBR8730444.1 hypothetical protein [Porphyromonas levii]
MMMKIDKKKVLKEIGFFAGILLLAGVISGFIDLTPHKPIAQTASQKPAAVRDITGQEFIDQIYDYTSGNEWNYKGDKPAVIDFYAVWCGPCKRLRPRLEQLAAEYGDEIVVYAIEVEKYPELMRMLGIQAFPTLLFVPTKGIPTLGQGLMSLRTLREEVEKIKK